MSPRPPVVSVVINNYNYARYVDDAIASALAQTYPHVEVVVVDDGSTDDSREVIARFGPRVRAVFKNNGGQGSALNAGFRESRGDIVMFLDADDLLLPSAAQSVVDAMPEGTAKVQFVLAHVDAERRPLGSTVPYEPAMMRSGDLRDLVLSGAGYVSPPTSGNAFARKFLEHVMPLDERDWRQGAETSLLVLAPFFGAVASIPAVHGLYRVHGRNHQDAFGKVSPRGLKIKLTLDVQRANVLREYGLRTGVDVASDWILRDPSHLKWRLASLRLDPEHHLFMDDSRWRLAARGIASSWMSPLQSMRSRLFLSAWFPLVAMLRADRAAGLIRRGLRGRPEGKLQPGSAVQPRWRGSHSA